MSHSKKLLSLLLLCTIPAGAALNQAPKLTVVIVIDQCAYHYFPKFKKNFKYGFKELFQKGTVYTKAFHPHGVPETAPGHHGISTGCYPKDHGVITNQWINENETKVHFETDNEPAAALIPLNKDLFENTTHQKNIDGHHHENRVAGKSGRKCMVDNLSDQFLQFNTPQNPAKVFALSIKSYPAIAMAGKMGKALWIDEDRGTFISSKMYFEKLPTWVEAFNNKKASSFAHYQWTPTYSINAPEYNYPCIRNYEHAGTKECYIGKFPVKINQKGDKRYSTLIKTPFANQLLLDLAKECVNQNLDLQSNDRMLLWVSLSQLDLLTHLFGPDSLETTDTLYQLDRQLKDFMNFLQRKVGTNNCLIALTADHGIAPIPEIQQKKGLVSARRILATNLIDGMNREVKNKFGISNMITAFEPNSFWLDKKQFTKLALHKQAGLLDALVTFLKCYPGIKDAWSYEELAKKDTRDDQFARYQKMQLFQGRIGQIICLPAPYCQITHYKTGTGHSTPYNYDTHVPLILYQPNNIRPQIIHDKVFVPQLPVTLARLLHITKPSATGFDVLPGFK